MQLPGALLFPRLFNKKIHPEKIPYISGNENFLYFFKRKIFLIFQETETPKKILYVSGNGAFLYFKKRKPRKNCSLKKSLT